MKDLWKPMLQIILMAAGLYAVLLGSYWYFVGP